MREERLSEVAHKFHCCLKEESLDVVDVLDQKFCMCGSECSGLDWRHKSLASLEVYLEHMWDIERRHFELGKENNEANLI